MIIPTTAPLDRTFSLYLDLTRFIAAALVVLSHFVDPALVSRSTGLAIPDLGREAVVLFFVLSGFVNAYTTHYKRQSPRDYIVARAARIYSVALPLLLLAFPLAAAAMYVTDFQPLAWYQLTKAHIYLPFHLLFAGELWTFSESPPSLSPYWSLNFEVWYYVLFGAAIYLQGKRRMIVLGALMLFVGPKLWLLLPGWWGRRQRQRGRATHYRRQDRARLLNLAAQAEPHLIARKDNAGPALRRVKGIRARIGTGREQQRGVAQPKQVLDRQRQQALADAAPFHCWLDEQGPDRGVALVRIGKPNNAPALLAHPAPAVTFKIVVIVRQGHARRVGELVFKDRQADRGHGGDVGLGGRPEMQLWNH